MRDATDGHFASPPCCSAHPRSRGENLLKVGGAGSVGGSSPLTRGKRTLISAIKPSSRLIPAHAGKTRITHLSSTLPAAHPRSRGENHRALRGPF